MGCDMIGWRNCQLQQQLGMEEFLWRLKLSSMKAGVMQQVPEQQRFSIMITLQRLNRESRNYSFQEILDELGDFENGIPECASCPVSSGRIIGCYRYVSYPIDEVFERLLFEFFVSQFQIDQSACNQIYNNIISKIPADNFWRDQRGKSGALAVLPQPLEHQFGGMLSKKKFDSAQVLAGMFMPFNSAGMIAVYGAFWADFVDYCNQKQIPHSRTLSEVYDMLHMFMPMVMIAVEEGGTIVVDG